jgi:hypothetical protein
MPSSGMLCRVALVRSDVSKERGVSIISVTRKILFLRSLHRLLVTANVIPSSLLLVTLMMEEVRSSETSVLTRATRRNILKDGMLILIALTIAT